MTRRCKLTSTSTTTLFVYKLYPFCQSLLSLTYSK